ncbi:MAG: hypothetical protein WD273_14575 [Trueperaceae bacterium]
MGATVVGLVVLGLLPLSAHDVSWFIAGMALLVSAAAIGLAWRTTPGESEMLRYVDDAVGLESRLVTARDLERRPPVHSVSQLLHHALLRDLQRMEPAIHVKRLVPLRFLPVHGIALVTILGSIAVANVVDEWKPSWAASLAEEADAFDPGWGELERSELAAELGAFARALEEEAAETGDAYTRALAESARALAQDVEDLISGLSAQEAEAEVASLLAHVERALGPNVSASGGRGASVETEMNPPDEIASSEDQPPLPTVGFSLPAAGAQMQDVLSDVRAVRERLEVVQSQRMDNPYGGSFEVGRRDSPANLQEAGVVGESVDGAAGTPAGAAQRSTDAPGDAAGAGSQDLDIGERTEAAAFERGEDVALPESANANGVRVQTSAEVGANAEGSASVVGRGAQDVTDGNPPIAVTSRDSIRRDAGGWRKEPLGPHARLLAQRLFEPENMETQE